MKRLQILIVDDNSDLADSLAAILKAENHLVTVTYNGEDAVTEIRRRSFDLAIIDLKLPGISGIEVFRTMSKERPEIKGIMMTGYGIEQVIAEMTGDTAVAVFRPPLQTQNLLSKIQELEAGGIILLADTTPKISCSIEKSLIKQGYKVFLAKDKDIDNIVAQVIENRADVLILDLNLSVLHSLNIFLELTEQGHSLPTLVVTKQPAQISENPDLLRSISVSGCLFKPFHPEALLSGINAIFSENSLPNT